MKRIRLVDVVLFVVAVVLALATGGAAVWLADTLDSLEVL